jgi:hypothetical protein
MHETSVRVSVLNLQNLRPRTWKNTAYTICNHVVKIKRTLHVAAQDAHEEGTSPTEIAMMRKEKLDLRC